MSGIMTATVGVATAVSKLYTAGLYVVGSGADTSPITDSAFNTSVSKTWIGYFTPASDGATTLSLQTTAFSGGGGGSASTTGQLWFGTDALVPSGGADITATNNQTASANFSMTQGVYYPIRIVWTGDYEEGFFGSDSSGSITFLAAGSSNVTNRIFYNAFTNGF